MSDTQTAESTETTAQAKSTWMARIHVSFKPVVLDPQGQAVLTGLHQLGFDDVSKVRVGKLFEITLSATDQEAAASEVKQMCERLLANPVIERYDYTVEETATAQS